MREVHDHPVDRDRTVEQHAAERDPTHTVDRTEYVAPAVERTEVVEGDPYAGNRGAAFKVVQAVHLIFGILVGLVGIRFVLKALGANPNADFATIMYNLTQPLVAPFVGLFGTPQTDGVVIEPQSLVAMLVYALLGWVLGRLVWVIMGETRTGRVRSTIRER